MGVQERDELSNAIMAAAERFCNVQNVGLTSKRLLYEFLAFPGPNGKTISGLFKPGIEPRPSTQVCLVDITRKFIGFHIIKHYYVMRQYHEASGVVLSFLKFLRSEATWPSALSAELNEAIMIAEEGVDELPHIMRIIRQPDVRNEIYSFRFPLRPFPLCTVPQTTAVKASSSRAWPSSTDQHHHAWINFASERCRIEPEELEAMLREVPPNLTVMGKTEGLWEVMAVQPDNTLVFKELDGDRTFEVPFSAKRAQDFRPGMRMCATFVTLSDGAVFVTDWGYVFPTFYAPYVGKDGFGPYDPVDLVYQ